MLEPERNPVSKWILVRFGSVDDASLSLSRRARPV
jgi:hypothetical protein